MQAQRTEIADYRNQVNAQIEQFANDRRELERMLASMTEQKVTHAEEREHTCQSITDREQELEEQSASLPHAQSRLEADTNDVQQKQREVESHQDELDSCQQQLESQPAERNQGMETRQASK